MHNTRVALICSAVAVGLLSLLVAEAKPSSSYEEIVESLKRMLNDIDSKDEELNVDTRKVYYPEYNSGSIKFSLQKYLNQDRYCGDDCNYDVTVTNIKSGEQVYHSLTTWNGGRQTTIDLDDSSASYDLKACRVDVLANGELEVIDSYGTPRCSHHVCGPLNNVGNGWKKCKKQYKPKQ